MSSIIYVVPVVLVIAISAIVVKIATIALKMTGLDEKKAHFQALSAFTGTGFTTRDSEMVLENNTRRKIIMVLMILGNAGLITVITTIILSLGRGGNMNSLFLNVGIVLILIFTLFKIATHKGITKFLNDKIESRLEKSPPFQKRPIEEIVRIAKNYGIAEVNISESCQDREKTLSESSFRENDILILAIERENTVIPAPKATDRIQKDDTLICYGKLSNIADIIKKQ